MQFARYVIVGGLSVLSSILPAQQAIAAKAQMSLSPRPTSAAERLATRVTIRFHDVPLERALEEIDRQALLGISYTRRLVPLERRVSIERINVTATEALNGILRGTDVVVVTQTNGNIVLMRSRQSKANAAQGTISGRVVDAKTKQPIPGATVTVEGTSLQAKAGDDGQFKIANVPEGSQTISARMLGYAKQTRPLMVGDGQSITVEVVLEASASVLDQLVVTGTIVQTELKGVPSAISVVTAKQLEERGITKIDQLFRGDIPGLFAQNQGAGAPLDEVTMFSRGATSLPDRLGGSASVGTTLGITNTIKTYIDGIELADPKYLSQIDPKSIERIEILTGPQASTIYGSNAINGVMQIFTKRGTTSRPQLALTLLSGWVENNFSTARTPQHDYTAQLSGLEGRLSYNAGGSWIYMGPWTPAKQFARTGGFGGARLDLSTPAGRISTDLSLRRTLTQSRQRGSNSGPLTYYRDIGWFSYESYFNGLAQPATRTLTGQTLGLTLSYSPTLWWSHELGLGQDASDSEQRVTARGYQFPFDTTLLLQQSHTDRRSLRYATTARLAVGSFAQVTATTGADAWQNTTSSMSVSPQMLTGSLTGSTTVSRRPSHNTGGFLQTQLGLKDRLFFTYGLRAEWNPDYGEDAQPSVAPRYGVAYTQELGLMTAKLRGSYGRSTRPPAPRLKVGQTVAEAFSASTFSTYFQPYYGNFDYQLANPDLSPEHQQGGEGGVELYVGTRGSLVVTRYNQTVDGLIAQAAADSVRTLVRCATFTPECLNNNLDADGYGYWRQLQYLNIGSIRNQGWELQGSMNVGPITTRGTYSWTKSRTIGVNPRYSASFVGQTQYQPGAMFRFLPEHTWALGATYARGPSSVGFNVTGVGRVTNLQSDFFLQSIHANIRLPQNRFRMTSSGFVDANTAYALADLTASHRFGSRVEGVLQVQNLTDRYTNDYRADWATLGRQLKFGARVRTP